MDIYAIYTDKLLIVGDFNFHIDNAVDTDTVRFNGLLESVNLTQHVTAMTHINGHILDLVITRVSDDIIQSVQTPTLVTDHSAVHCMLRLGKPPLPRKKITYRRTKCINHDNLHDDIAISSLITDPSPDLDGLVSQYDCVLSALFDRHAPQKSRTITVHPAVPWYTDEITQAKKTRRHYEQRWRKTRFPEDRLLFQLPVSRLTP